VWREDKIVESMKANDKNLVKMVEPKDVKDGKRVKVIMTKTIEGKRKLWYRTITYYWCSKCVIGDYDNCVKSSIERFSWTMIDAKEESRCQRVLARLPTEDRSL